MESTFRRFIKESNPDLDPTEVDAAVNDLLAAGELLRLPGGTLKVSEAGMAAVKAWTCTRCGRGPSTDVIPITPYLCDRCAPLAAVARYQEALLAGKQAVHQLMESN